VGVAALQAVPAERALLVDVAALQAVPVAQALPAPVAALLPVPAALLQAQVAVSVAEGLFRLTPKTLDRASTD
jgi:hypothetical protein